MASWWNAFVSWNHRSALENREVAESSKRFRKAIDAEDELGQLVTETLGHVPDHIHLRKRVYVSTQQRSREIDVIAVTDALYVVEVKNWSGDIWRNETRWFQQPPKQGARALEFGDLLDEVNFKAKALVAYLHGLGITLPPGCVRPCVVFASKNCRLDPKTVANHPCVFTRASFQLLVGPRRAWRDTAVDWVPTLLARKDEITLALRARVSDALARLRTWDVIELQNGERVTGDLHRITLPEYRQYERRTKNTADEALTLNKRDLANAEMVWATSSWWGLADAIWRGSAGELVITLAPNVRLVKPRGKAGKKAPGAAAAAAEASEPPPKTLRVPVTIKSAKSTMPTVNRVTFHPAGKPNHVHYTLSEIRRLEVCVPPPEPPRIEQKKPASPTTVAAAVKK